MSNIVEFPGKPPSIAPFLRIGYSGYKKASQLLSQGHLPPPKNCLKIDIFRVKKSCVKESKRLIFSPSCFLGGRGFSVGHALR